MPEDQDLGILQRIDVHLRVLDTRGVIAEIGAVNARDRVVAGREALLLQGRFGARLLGDIGRHRNVPAEQMPLDVDDIGLASVEQTNAHPLLRPNAHVDEVLEVLEGLLVKEHAREVIGDAQELEVFCRGGADVLLEGRVRVTGKERVRVNVAGDANHGGLQTSGYRPYFSHGKRLVAASACLILREGRSPNQTG